MGEKGLKPIDATACFSLEAWSWIEGLRWNNAKGEEAKKVRKGESSEEGGNSYVGISGG